MSLSASSFTAAIAGNKKLLAFNRGIERESLRVTPDGDLALTPHPVFLGSKLTHPKVTTDFSESQLELITGVHDTPQGAIKELNDIHRLVYSELKDELLWSASMPCMLGADGDIPLAYYGDSNLGRLKTTYRNGLGNRYGRAMQTICAVHYNFSFSDEFWQWLHHAEASKDDLQDFISRRYFDLMRNFRRYSWLLTYLFGASPAVCNSFVKDRQHSLQAFDASTAFLPDATSLRSGNLGYQSDTQAERMDICYNSLGSYVSSLATAICEPHQQYIDIGQSVGDEHKQVNCNILQSEAEFYSSIRAKRLPGPGENFLACLLDQGVQYIEVRLLDVNPYLPLGIDEQQIKFLDMFLCHCLIQESPEHDDQLCQEVTDNALATVYNGRSGQVSLKDRGQDRSFSEWAEQLMKGLEPYAELLDGLETGSDTTATSYSNSLSVERRKISNPSETPAGAVLEDMRAGEVPFFRFAMDQTLAHRDRFNAEPLTDQEVQHFAALARVSVADQQSIEQQTQLPFEDYLLTIAEAYEPLRDAP